MKQTVLITGINGFLGNRLKEILKDKYKVYGIAKQETSFDDIIIYSSSQLEKITIDPDYLILCHAAVSSGRKEQDHDLLYNVNVKLTSDIINKFSCSRIIYISTASIFNNRQGVISESTIDSPINEYSISKLWAEKLVLKTNRAVIVRLSSLFGIDMKENTIIPNYVNQGLNKEHIEVWGEGNRFQNYILVDDVCAMLIKVINNYNSVLNQICLAVNFREYSNLELAKIIAAETNATIKYVNEDNSISLNYNNEKTQILLDWKSTSNFKEEIIKYIRWKRKQY